MPRDVKSSRSYSSLDTFALYELCVTEPHRVVRFIEAAHGASPLVLREDFSGSGALARAWAASSSERSAFAVDAAAEPLRRLKQLLQHEQRFSALERESPLKYSQDTRVRTLRARAERCRVKADVIAATNFPLGYFHTRQDLLAYLRAARTSLRPRGIFLADMYGGADAFTPMKLERIRRGPSRERVRYTWEQRECDALTGLVLDTLSFRVMPKHGRPRTFTDAFVYHWRLWSIPELTDALHESGFRTVDVYDSLADAVDHLGNTYVRPVDPGELDRNWVVYVVAR